MARIEIAHLGDLKVEHANISDVVGTGGKNEKSDVMLIQALFALAGPNEFSARKFFGLARKDLPEPDGEINAKTVRAIWAFQTRMSYRLLNTDEKFIRQPIRTGLSSERLTAV